MSFTSRHGTATVPPDATGSASTGAATLRSHILNVAGSVQPMMPVSPAPTGVPQGASNGSINATRRPQSPAARRSISGSGHRAYECGPVSERRWSSIRGDGRNVEFARLWSAARCVDDVRSALGVWGRALYEPDATPALTPEQRARSIVTPMRSAMRAYTLVSGGKIDDRTAPRIAPLVRTAGGPLSSTLKSSGRTS